MGVLSWILFGALAGWLASIIAGTNRRQSLIMDIIIGVVGAFVGGLATQLVTGHKIDFGWNLSSLLVAVVGAVMLLLLFARRRR